MTTRKIIPLDEGRDKMPGPEDYATTQQYSDESLPIQSVPGAVPATPPDAQETQREKVLEAPLSNHTPRTSARVSFDATAVDKPVRRRTMRQRTASKLASAVSMQTLITPLPSTKAELLAKQNQAIANIKHPSMHITRVEKVAYEIDQYISTRKGQIFTLTVVGLILIAIGGVFLKAVQPSRKFGETVWESWTYLADTGSHTSLTQDVRIGLHSPAIVTWCLIDYFHAITLAGLARGGSTDHFGGHSLFFHCHGVRR